MSGLTSQPSMGALVAALRGTSLDTGIDLQQAQCPGYCDYRDIVTRIALPPARSSALEFSSLEVEPWFALYLLRSEAAPSLLTDCIKYKV